MTLTEFETIVREQLPADGRRLAVPVYVRRSADLLTPVSAFLALREAGQFGFLLESVEGGERLGRYSFLGKSPYLVVESRGARTRLHRPAGGYSGDGAPHEIEPVEGNTFEVLDRILAETEQAAVEGLPRLTAGAVGFATSTAPQHNGWGGVPMPSRLADARELETLVTAMGEDGRGVFMLTKGNTTDVPYLETVAAKSGRPVMIAALLHNPTNPDGTFKDLAAVAAARANGRELWGQVSCCPLYMDFSLKSAYPLEGLTAWKPAMEDSGEALKAVYASDAFRQAVKDELSGPAGVRLFNGEWDKIEVTETARPENRAYDQKKVAGLAEAAGKHPLDWMLDLAIS